MSLSCTTCKGFEPIFDAYGRVTKGLCHGRCPIPQVFTGSENTEIVMVFGTIYLPNFCLEHVYDETKIIPPPPPTVTL